MILLKFYLAIFSIFIAPQIFIYYKYNKLPYSLTLLWGMILSFTSVWVLTLLSYAFNLPDTIFFIIAIVVSISSIIYLIKKFQVRENNNYIVLWLIVFTLLAPIYKYMGEIYPLWDALVSWHRWGLNLYNNIYDPIDAAYPVLVPSLISMVYKIEGTSDIWWSSKLILYIFPILSLITPLVLYKESKNIIFILMAIFIYPYTLMEDSISGYVDIPVMLMGMVSLYALMAAEINKKDSHLFHNYLYVSILLAGISSITKQAGLIFVVFEIVYILLNLKYIEHKRKVFFVVLAMFLYFISFMILYKLNAHVGATGNLKYLMQLAKKYFNDPESLYFRFFTVPDNIEFFSPINNFLHKPLIVPIIFIFSLFIYIIELILHKVNRYKALATISLIFTIVSFLFWARVASYAIRDGIFVKSFLILFISISLYYFFTYLKRYKFLRLATIIFAIVFIGYIFSLISNKYAYKKQYSQQSQLGGEKLAKFLIKEFNNKKCLKLYTSNYSIQFNSFMQKYRNRIISDDFIGNQNFLIKAVNNSCKEGNYILARQMDKFKDSWSWFDKLAKKKKIVNVNGFDLLFKVNPNTHINKDFFEDKTDFANIEINNYDSNISYSIDAIKRYNNVYMVQGWAFVNNKSNKLKTYIVLDNNKSKKFIINTKSLTRVDVSKRYNLDNNMTGFKSYIVIKDFKKAKYKIGILIIDNLNNKYLIESNKVIDIK